MKSILLLSLALFTNFTFARQIAPGVQSIDEQGKAVILREGQTAAVLVMGDAAKHLKQMMPNLNEKSQIFCGEGYCLVGQFDRQGRLGAFTALLQRAQIEKNLALKANAQSYYEENLFEHLAGQAFSNPSQCQDEQRRQIPEVDLVIQGQAAEVLYNFLIVPDNRTERVFGNAKMAAQDLIFCEKLPHHDSADMSENGVPLAGAPLSYTEYSCNFKFSKTGVLQKRQRCNVYGGTISAGGGGK